MGRSAHVVYISYLIIIVTVMPPKAPPTHIGCFSIKGPVQLEHQAPPAPNANITDENFSNGINSRAPGGKRRRKAI